MVSHVQLSLIFPVSGHGEIWTINKFLMRLLLSSMLAAVCNPETRTLHQVDLQRTDHPQRAQNMRIPLEKIIRKKGTTLCCVAAAQKADCGLLYTAALVS
jgi:hypothetical protein